MAYGQGLTGCHSSAILYGLRLGVARLPFICHALWPAAKGLQVAIHLQCFMACGQGLPGFHSSLMLYGLRPGVYRLPFICHALWPTAKGLQDSIHL